MRLVSYSLGVGGSVYMAVNHNGEPVNVKIGIGNSTPGAALDIENKIMMGVQANTQVVFY